MVSLSNVDYFILTGNTYANLDLIRACGARWDNGARYWQLQVNKHPMNNSKQKKKLQDMLNKLEENGVRFVAWYLNPVKP